MIELIKTVDNPFEKSNRCSRFIGVKWTTWEDDDENREKNTRETTTKKRGGLDETQQQTIRSDIKALWISNWIGEALHDLIELLFSCSSVCGLLRLSFFSHILHSFVHCPRWIIARVGRTWGMWTDGNNSEKFDLNIFPHSWCTQFRSRVTSQWLSLQNTHRATDNRLLEIFHLNLFLSHYGKCWKLCLCWRKSPGENWKHFLKTENSSKWGSNFPLYSGAVYMHSTQLHD